MAYKFLDETLKPIPGARLEVLEKERFDKFLKLAHEKVNQIELYVVSTGRDRWDWKDFIEKMASFYATRILEKLEHQLFHKAIKPHQD